VRISALMNLINEKFFCFFFGRKGNTLILKCKLKFVNYKGLLVLLKECPLTNFNMLIHQASITAVTVQN
jgi:hypothetical protein